MIGFYLEGEEKNKKSKWEIQEFMWAQRPVAFHSLTDAHRGRKGRRPIHGEALCPSFLQYLREPNNYFTPVQVIENCPVCVRDTKDCSTERDTAKQALCYTFKKGGL